MTKGKAFIIGLIAVMVVFFTMIIYAVDNKNPDDTIETRLIPVEAVLTAIGALAAAYITGNVVDHGVKGKHWNQQMFDSENSQRPIGTIRGDV